MAEWAFFDPRMGAERNPPYTRWPPNEQRALRRTPQGPENWSGRPDSNRRRPAWEAGILPLNYGRSTPPILLATRDDGAALLDRHLRGLDALVAARLPADPLARAVEVELLVEGRGRGVLDPQLVDLMIEGQPLLFVHLLLRGVHEAVEVRVRVRTEVAAGAEQRAVHRLGVDGRRAPADQPHGPALVLVGQVVEVVHELVGLHRRLDPRLGELAGRRLGDFLVTHVPPLRSVERQLEPIGKARLGQQLLGLGDVLLDRLERGIVAEV